MSVYGEWRVYRRFSRVAVLRPFIFVEETVRANNYLDTLQEFVLPH
jgi:hypothetical protein